MTRFKLYFGASRWVLIAGLAAALPLAACNRSDQASQSSQAPAPLAALPLADSSAPAIAPAPAASALPPAAPIRVGRLANRRDSYAFADQAYALNNAFGDAPPDYGIDYGGTQPWVWRSNDNAMRVAEPLPGGGDRYYYYEPGADYPYLVRDPSYTYGYDNGVLVVIYDQSGHALPEGEYQSRRDYASRFYARGRGLYDAAQQQDQRRAVAQGNWSARRNQFADEQSRWSSAQANDSEWRDYHQAHEQQEQAQWSDERYRREAEAARFAQSVNDQQTAMRDWQAAQRAQQRAQQQQQQQPPQQQQPGQGGGGGGFNRPQQPSGPGNAPASPPNYSTGPSGGSQFHQGGGQNGGQDNHQNGQYGQYGGPNGGQGGGSPGEGRHHDRGGPAAPNAPPPAVVAPSAPQRRDTPTPANPVAQTPHRDSGAGDRGNRGADGGNFGDRGPGNGGSARAEVNTPSAAKIGPARPDVRPSAPAQAAPKPAGAPVAAREPRVDPRSPEYYKQLQERAAAAKAGETKPAP
jgi:hypothetical protein